MRKSNPRRVQEIPLKNRQIARAGAQNTWRAIKRVSDNGMPDGGEMRANLVRAPRVEGGFNKRAAVQARNYAPVGSRMAALGRTRGHACAAARVPGNGQRDRPRFARHLSMHER